MSTGRKTWAVVLYGGLVVVSPVVLFWFLAGDSVDPDYDKSGYVAKVLLVWGTVMLVATWLLERTLTRPTRPPAGWYSDPLAPTGLRWWDGREWTAGVALPHPPPGAPPS